jgi:hypothetical protein
MGKPPLNQISGTKLTKNARSEKQGGTKPRPQSKLCRRIGKAGGRPMGGGAGDARKYNDDRVAIEQMQLAATGEEDWILEYSNREGGDSLPYFSNATHKPQWEAPPPIEGTKWSQVRFEGNVGYYNNDTKDVQSETPPEVVDALRRLSAEGVKAAERAAVEGEAAAALDVSAGSSGQGVQGSSGQGVQGPSGQVVQGPSGQVVQGPSDPRLEKISEEYDKLVAYYTKSKKDQYLLETKYNQLQSVNIQQRQQLQQLQLQQQHLTFKDRNHMYNGPLNIDESRMYSKIRDLERDKSRNEVENNELVKKIKFIKNQLKKTEYKLKEIERK